MKKIIYLTLSIALFSLGCVEKKSKSAEKTQMTKNQNRYCSLSQMPIFMETQI